MRAQQHERVARVAEAEERPYAEARPERAREPVRDDRNAGVGVFAGRRLPDAREQQERDRAPRGGEPKHRPERHAEREQRDRHERPDDGADRVERPVVAERGAHERRRRRRADEGIPRRCTRRLSDAVERAGGEHPSPRRRQREERPRRGRQRVAGPHPCDAAASEAVGQPSRDPAKTGGGAVGDPLDQADDRNGRTERRRQEERQDGVEELAPEVVRERHPRQGADVLR